MPAMAADFSAPTPIFRLAPLVKVALTLRPLPPAKFSFWLSNNPTNPELPSPKLPQGRQPGADSGSILVPIRVTGGSTRDLVRVPVLVPVIVRTLPAKGWHSGRLRVRLSSPRSSSHSPLKSSCLSQIWGRFIGRRLYMGHEIARNPKPGMSEFLSICPKCRQRIICDTTYVGMRVACPQCLQEITMPAPPVEIPAEPLVPESADSAQTEPLVPLGKRRIPLAPVLAAGVLMIAAAGVGIVMLGRQRPNPAPEPTPVTASPVEPVEPATPPAPANASLAMRGGASSTLTPDSRPGSAPAVVMPFELNVPCRAHWTFDQLSGMTAIDSSGNGFNATLVGDHATLTKAARLGGGALKLSDYSYAETAGPVVDTTRSFTVAAWVNFNLIEKNGCQTVLGIDGTNASAFYLQLNHPAGDRFVFLRREKDNADLEAKQFVARSNYAPERNTWYHLAGVYDAQAKTISLYVDGRLQESVPFASPWHGVGKTSIGRGLYSANNLDFVNGSIDDVRIYATVLTADQIQMLAGRFENLAAK